MIGKAAVSIGGILSTKRDDLMSPRSTLPFSMIVRKTGPAFPDHAPSQKRPGANGCRLTRHAISVPKCLRARAFIGSSGGPSKAGSEFPRQHVKTKSDAGDFCAPNQTIISVNARLPKENA